MNQMVKINRVEPRFISGDCQTELKKIRDEDIHLILTDPPYFLDRLDNEWDNNKIDRANNPNGLIGGKLPDGMKFDPAQGKRLQSFIGPIAEEMLRVLKPGGFLLMFSSPRLYHRAAVAVEDAGFEIRDCFAWRYTKKAQFKAFSMDHFVRKSTDFAKSKKLSIINKLGGRKTPQLRPQFEPILCAQKPKEGTFVNNWLKHETGLIDATEGLDNSIPQTVMTVEKDTRSSENFHVTPKPIALCEHLIRVFSIENQKVLDPFVGSGTTCIAAYNTKRIGIGIDVNAEHIEIAQKRMENSK